MDIEYLGPLDRRENYDPEVVRAALKYGIDPDLAVSVHRQEYSPDKWISSAGARGPMQLMPGTARELGVDPDDPQQNIDGGVRYLGQMLKAFGGDQVLALAAYNAGPGRVKAGTLPIETRRYTRDVIFRAKRLRQAAPEIEYLGPLEEEAPEIEYLGPLEEDLGQSVQTLCGSRFQRRARNSREPFGERGRNSRSWRSPMTWERRRSQPKRRPGG